MDLLATWKFRSSIKMFANETHHLNREAVVKLGYDGDHSLPFCYGRKHSGTRAIVIILLQL